MKFYIPLKELENTVKDKKLARKYYHLFFKTSLKPEQKKEIWELIKDKYDCQDKLQQQNNNNNKFEKNKNNIKEIENNKEELYLKKIAELDNKIKLLEKEHKNKIINNEFKILKDILQILDTLEIAIANIEKNEQTQAIHEGIENTIKKFYSILENYKVNPVQHEHFDPELHQAIAMEPGEEGKILKVFQKGFEKEGKLIRPGIVVVGKS